MTAQDEFVNGIETSSAAAVVSVAKQHSYEIKHEPFIATETLFDSEETLWGSPSLTVRQLGGELGDDFASVSEQLQFDPGGRYLAVYHTYGSHQKLGYVTRLDKDNSFFVGSAKLNVRQLRQLHEGRL